MWFKPWHTFPWKTKLAEQCAFRDKTPITERDVSKIGSIVERTHLSVKDYLDGTDEQVTSHWLSGYLRFTNSGAGIPD